MKIIIKASRLIASLSIIAICIAIFDGCKKINDSDFFLKETQTEIDKTKQNISNQMMEMGGIPQIFPVNKPMTPTWVDKFGKPVTKAQILSNGFVSDCNFDLPTYTNLTYYTRIFQCAGLSLGGPGYFIEFEYHLSWNNNIIPTNGSIATAGYIEIYDDFSNTLQFNTTITGSDVKIEDLGVDFGNNHIFKVSFKYYPSTPLASYFINGDLTGDYTVKLGATFVTDCKTGGDPYSLYILPASLSGFTGASGNDPCKRNELAWFDGIGTTGSYTNRMKIAGYDPLSPSPSCGYGSPFIRPDLQEVEYSTDGGLNWTGVINDVTASGIGIAGTKYIRKDDVARSIAFLTGTYNVIIRFRNWKYGTPPSPGTWPIPSTGNGDCHSPGDGSATLNTTFAYKYVTFTI